MLAHIIYHKCATLHELKTVYSLEDAHLIYEAIVVPEINNYFAMKKSTS